LEEIQETRFVNVKALLNWSVLCMDKFSATAATFTLLHVNDTSTSVRPLLAAEVNSKKALGLVQLFLAHLHIYNPVLVVAKIEEHMSYTGLNGLEWDAHSSTTPKHSS
jgi:hypothetical protein